MRKSLHFDSVNKSETFDVNPKSLFYSVLLVNDDGCLEFSETKEVKIVNTGDEVRDLKAALSKIPKSEISARSKLEFASLDMSKIAFARPNMTLEINTRCYFAFIMSKKIQNWYIDFHSLGLTLKPNPKDPMNDASYHSRIDQIIYFNKFLGTLPVAKYTFDHPENFKSDCCIVAIGIKEMNGGEVVGVNLHVEVSTDTGDVVPTIFDPDIKNTGGGFTPTNP